MGFNGDDRITDMKMVRVWKYKHALSIVARERFRGIHQVEFHSMASI